MDNYTLFPIEPNEFQESVLKAVSDRIKSDPNVAEDFVLRISRTDDHKWSVSTLGLVESLCSDSSHDYPLFELMKDLNLDRSEEEWVGDFEDWTPDLEAISDLALTYSGMNEEEFEKFNR